MASPAEPLTELLRSASASIAECRGVLETPDGEKPDADTVAYCIHSLITAVDRLALLARRYMVAAEFRATARDGFTTATPVLSDPAFRACATATADQIEGSAALGVSGGRLALTLRTWIESRSPECARLLASQCETALRILKRKAR